MYQATDPEGWHVDGDTPSLGEAHRRLDRLEARVDNRVVSLNTYMAEQQAIREDLKTLREDLKAMSDRITWAWRIAVTGVILPIAVTIIGSVSLALILGGTP